MNSQLRATDQWIGRQGPENHVVVSSRARYARNLPRIPFPLRASASELNQVVEMTGEVISRNPRFKGGMALDLSQLPSNERHFLKENHLISSELEKGGAHRLIFLTADITLAVMVNEEDHLRLFAIDGGFQLGTVLNRLFELEDELEKELPFAFSSKFGFLTACPTNTGTGLRASVLLHLPALAAAKKLQDLIKELPQSGLTIRGPYGENSESLGDFFQVSNEVTLGRSEEEIVEILTAAVSRIIEREVQARHTMFEKNGDAADDEIWRAWGLLTNARVITGQEAVHLLSRLRLGIDRGYLGPLSHADLNRLIIEVQPGHVQLSEGSTVNVENRDWHRADFLRARLTKTP